MSERSEHIEHTSAQNPAPTHAGHGTAPGYMSRKDDYAQRIAASRGRCAASHGWSTRRSTASTSSPRSRRSPRHSKRSHSACSRDTWRTASLDAAADRRTGGGTKVKEASDAIARLVRS